jgi:hypothetical protein
MVGAAEKVFVLRLLSMAGATACLEDNSVRPLGGTAHSGGAGRLRERQRFRPFGPGGSGRSVAPTLLPAPGAGSYVVAPDWSM